MSTDVISQRVCNVRRLDVPYIICDRNGSPLEDAVHCRADSTTFQFMLKRSPSALGPRVLKCFNLKIGSARQFDS